MSERLDKKRPSRYDSGGDAFPAVDPFARSTAVLRLGAVRELGALPLIRGLDGIGGITLESRAAGPLAARFEAGTLDCALLPMLDCARFPACRAIPGIGACSIGESKTEVLFTSTEPRNLRKIAVHFEAGSAASIARVVLGEVFGVRPDFIPVSPEAFDPESCDGIVVSGDLVWSLANPWTSSYDLGMLWYELTGFPLARMLWVAQRTAPFPRLRSVLGRAIQRGQAELPAIAQEAEANGIADSQIALDYLARTQYYSVGGRELDGIAEFLRRAATYGLCAADASIELC